MFKCMDISKQIYEGLQPSKKTPGKIPTVMFTSWSILEEYPPHQPNPIRSTMESSR